MIWVLLAGIVAVFVGVFVLRPRVGGLFSGDFQGIKTEAIVGPIVTLAVFLTAFVVAQATLTFQRTNQAVSREANAIELLAENAGLLPDATGRNIQATSVCYARSVANLEFETLQDGRTAPETEWWATQFNQQIPEVLDGPGSVVGQIVTLSRQQSEARSDRLFDAQPNLPVLTLTMLVVAVIGVLLAISTLAVPDMRRGVLLTLALLFAVLLGGTLFMIEQLEEPFTGLIRVKPDSIEAAAGRVENRLPAGTILPCDDQGRPVSPEAVALVERGESPLVVCTDAPYPPFEEEDPTGGSPSGYTGFDMDLAQSVANSADRTLVVVDLPFGRLFDAVSVGVCDAVFSAVTITPEREEQVDFSRPYLEVTQALVVRSEDSTTDSLTGLSGRTVGVKNETTGKAYVEANRPPGVRIETFESTAAMDEALRAGRIAALVDDTPAADALVASGPGLRIAATLETGDRYGVAVAAGDTETLELVNRGLDQAESDGTLAGLQQQYLGTLPAGS